MTDKSLMPYGRYKGMPMAGVPAAYLLRVLENGNCRADLKAYILDNQEVLLREIQNRPKLLQTPDPFGDRL